jgi:hypothetical protein
MSKGQRPDPRKRKTGAPRSTHFKVANGRTELGYKAGDMYGCYGHRLGAHQPCMIELTGGELQCPLCTAGLDKVWRGYVPCWDRDFTLKHALIGEDYFESVDMIPHRAQIILTRDKAPISPLVIRAGDVATLRELPNKLPWTQEIDMYAICRVLWKNPAVDAWYATTHGAPAGPVGDSAPLVVQDFSAMMRGAAARVNRLATPRGNNDAFVEAHKNGKHVPEPGSNGHHKKKGS